MRVLHALIVGGKVLRLHCRFWGLGMPKVFARCCRAVSVLVCAWLLFAYTFTTSALARQIAFVVGIGTYETVGSLKNPKRDAAAIADRLRDIGFDVTELFDGDTFALKRAADQFIASARTSDMALFYFAGHGIQLFDRNVLLARDAAPERINSIDELGLDLTAFMTRLRAVGPTRAALLIDACRNNPLRFEETIDLLRRLESKTSAAGRSATQPTRGLATLTLPANQSQTGSGEMLVMFAAQPGHVSFDGTGQNSYFVEGLLQALSDRKAQLFDMFRSASGYVRTVTNGQQVPQLVSDWTSDIVLGRQEAANVRYLNATGANGRELTEGELKIVGHAQRAFGGLSGRFIVQESQVFSGDVMPATQQERDRARTIGMANGFAIDYDLDRDGHPETLAVYVRQVPVVIEVVGKGVSYIGTPCVGQQMTDEEEVESVELALRDINGDRRPEVFMHFRTKGNAWGTLCILEYVGSSRLAVDRRGPAADYSSSDQLFRTLLRYEGAQSVRIGEDNTIETCSGSNCHTRTVFSFDGTYFRMLLNQSDKPTGERAKPFRDQAERDRLVPRTTARAHVPVAVITPQDNNSIEMFVTTYLADNSDPKVIGAQYADRVSYFGKQKTRAQIITEKIAYHTKWPARTYALVPETLAVVSPNTRSGPHQVNFEYTFRVTDGSGRVVQGRGRTALQLARAGIQFVITREEGAVTERR